MRLNDRKGTLLFNNHEANRALEASVCGRHPIRFFSYNGPFAFPKGGPRGWKNTKVKIGMALRPDSVIFTPL